ncbi:Rv3654c family TadE-like protein [Streptomyces sp. SYSU K21746]
MRPARDRRRGPGGADADRGSATVWAAVVSCALCVVFAAVMAMGQAVVARHRSGAAADLAALAAADHWIEGQEGACGKAARVARAQGSRLLRCHVQGEISDVTAVAGFGPFTSAARSRAGPPGAAGPPGPEAAPSGAVPPGAAGPGRAGPPGKSQPAARG